MNIEELVVREEYYLLHPDQPNLSGWVVVSEVDRQNLLVQVWWPVTGGHTVVSPQDLHRA